MWVQNACSDTLEVGRKYDEMRVSKVLNALNYINSHNFWAESLDSGHQAGEGWPPDLRCSTESTHLDLDAGTGGQVLRPCAAVLSGVTLRALLKKRDLK